MLFMIMYQSQKMYFIHFFYFNIVYHGFNIIPIQIHKRMKMYSDAL